jgi:hypothetical protein
LERTIRLRQWPPSPKWQHGGSGDNRM